MAVGEAILSAILDVLFDKLASKHVLDFVRGHDIKNDLKRLQGTLKKVNAVLNDAEDQQYKNEEVKLWLDELKDAAYDAEDVLDEFATEALRRQLEAESGQPTSNQVWSSFLPYSLNPSVRSSESKIKAIIDRFDELANERFDLGLKEVAAAAGNSSVKVRETSSVVDESGVYGRGNDKEKIIQLLLKHEPKISVIPIVGMGGIGKTTLAQIVYNNQKMESHFDVKAWTCVSDDFDVKRITKSILNSVGFPATDSDDLNQVQVQLTKALTGKKFLIVLDDVWSKKYSDWDLLQAPFQVGAPGSKIIVTTRIRDVASKMGTVDNHYLEHLSNDDCWSVFVRHAFGNTNIDTKPNLVAIGKRIVSRCKGLPLAAKTLGGLLRSNLEEDEWEEILNSRIWDLPDEENEILPALKLSYHHLPSHLKRCFAYCAIFPKDYEFDEEELVLLWMAEGLVQQPNQRKQLETVGAMYFHDLLSRSFFQVSSNNKSMFVMHGLINDLAEWVAGDICCRLEVRKQCKISKKARHLSYVGSRYDGVQKFEAFDEVECLRTFLPLMTPRRSYLTHNVPLNLLPKLRWLRVLSLGRYYITNVPESIGDLKYLRYLNLSCPIITSLPESTSKLYNLQTLILKDCFRLKKLPTTMENLVNLRLLDITNANLIEEMPMGVSKWRSLRRLSNFIVGNNSGSGIKELMNLQSLHGTLCISSLENVTNARDARLASLKDKQDLDVLTMEWNSKFNASRNEGVEKVVLEMLQPHEKLKKLTIKGFGGIEFPLWVGNASFSGMVVLSLESCVKCTSLPPLGLLPSLKDLCIKGMDEVNSVGMEFYGEGCLKPFPSLETLSFVGMGKWNDWFHYGVDKQVEVFPSLRELSIKKCPKLLGKLPDHLPSLEKLIICGCQQLAVSVSCFPKLCKLKIQECQEVVNKSMDHLSSLESICFSNISKLMCLTEGFMRRLTQVQDLEIVGCIELMSLWKKEGGLLQHLDSLRHLRIKSYPEFVSLVGEEVLQQLRLPCALKSLQLESCRNLEKIEGLHSLNSLRRVTIIRCPRLVSITEISLLSMLRELKIHECRALKSMHCCEYRSLENLYISHCDSLISIARGQLPSTLKKLEIYDCKNLQSLVEDEDEDEEGVSTTSTTSTLHNSNPSLLEHLFISHCPSFKSISLSGELPATLKHLEIWSCPKMESVAERFHNNTSLEFIVMYNCGNLKSLPEGLHNLTNLSSIQILRCPRLVTFPAGGLPHHMHNLTSLQDLVIGRCPGLVSFPEEGFPTNLTSLEIRDLKICKPLFDWGLHRLTSLRELIIGGGCLRLDSVSFPDEEKGIILPTSLTGLTIREFPNLEYLSSKSFRNLVSLEILEIKNCPKLKSFPEEGLPPSLLQLRISDDCPLLKQRCKKNQGPDWLKIAHIPYVEIDERFIFDNRYDVEQ